MPDALSRRPDLAAVVVEDDLGSDLVDKIRAAQEVASGPDWESLVTEARAGGGSYTERGGLVCRSLSDGKVSLVVPHDPELRR